MSITPKTKKKLFRVLFYFLLYSSVSVIMFPVIITIFSSLMSEHELYLNNYQNFHLFPNEWNTISELFENYRYVITSSKRAVDTFINSLKIAIPTTIIATVSACLAAYPLSRTNMKGRKMILLLFLFASMVPTMAILIPLYLQFVNLSLYDTIWGLVIVLTAYTLPFSIWVMKSFYDTIPYALEEAALIDGCTRFKALLRVIIPVAMPGIGAVSVYTFIIAWSNFVIGMILTKTKSTPFTVYVGVLCNMENMEITKILATGVISSIPVVILALLFQKLIIRGLVEGAVKG